MTTKVTMPVALIQFDAVPEEVEANRNRMLQLTERAAELGARWILFHEGSLCDYTPRLKELAEPAPDGPSTRAFRDMADQLGASISFGISEIDSDRYYITQVFVGPGGYVYRYRKTWLWREDGDREYRNEHARYDPGEGPGLFLLDGVRATCFICADGVAPRCIERAAALRPEVVFYPNNRAALPEFAVFGEYARRIGAPVLVTNRIGKSWGHDCVGGCAVFGADGAVLARANREGREEMLLHDLEVTL